MNLRKIPTKIAEGKVKNTSVATRRLFLQLFSIMTDDYLRPKISRFFCPVDIESVCVPWISHLDNFVILTIRILQHGCTDLNRKLCTKL
jgi:hypothetical protein